MMMGVSLAAPPLRILHVDAKGRGGQTSNRIGCILIALYKTCLLTLCSAHIVAVVGRLSGL